MDDFNDSDDELLGIDDNPIHFKVKNNWKCYHKNRKTRYIETIENNRYQHMKEIYNVRGFILNIHDSTNFDIDFELPDDTHKKYMDVISNNYKYQDLSSHFFEKDDSSPLYKEDLINGVLQGGTTYRCRLKGIGINKTTHYANIVKSNKMCIEVKQLIDRVDGWVVCTLGDIDIYKRLLVDIYIHTPTEIINLKEHLLSMVKDDIEPIFCEYIGKKQ
jgi:hypothetical protein